MKRKLSCLLLAILSICVLCLVGCGAPAPDKGNGEDGDGNTNPPPTSGIEITGITFQSQTYIYDGTEKIILISGNLPQGVSVSYDNNKGTTANVYHANAVLSGEGYKTLTLSATLTISKATYDLSNVAWNYSSPFKYDGQVKTVTLSGLPDGVSINTYSENSKTNAGDYTATATLNFDSVNYNTPSIPTCSWKINKATYDLSNVAWNYSSPFTYDGQVKTVTLSGLPDGVSVKTYSENSKTNAGNYTATATLNFDSVNYNTPIIPTCSWKINKADIIGVTFDTTYDTVEYDTKEHSIVVTGNFPKDASVVYKYNGEIKNSVSEVGEYTITAIITAPNYNDLTLTATLVIKSTEIRLYSAVNNDTVYFQNNLDSNKLYKTTNQGIKKVNNDSLSHMIVYDGKIYYFSASVLGSSIKELSSSNATPLYKTNGEFLATDGTYLYYAINNTLINNEENGIYKIALDGSNETATRICTEKAEYLTYVNGYIYYSNLSESKHLYKVSTTSKDAKGILVWEENTTDIITDGSCLYFNAGNMVARAIFKHVISSNTTIKLTTDNGKYLTKVGSYIYYVNNDKLTSELFGDGIYKISALATNDNHLPGTKVLSIENNGFSSLASDELNLYYYKLNDKHFYSYNLSSETETDLMEDFEVVDDTTLSGYVKLAEYNSEIYYTNVLDYGYLYKYNPTTKANLKVIDQSVATVHFYQDYMYYSTYILGNYAMWRMDMKTSQSIKISSDRLEHLIFDGNTIYCIKVGSAYNNFIYKMNLDGSNPEKIFDTTLWVSDFFKEGNYIYCVANTMLGNDKIYKFDVTTNSGTAYDFESEAFTVYNGIIYYYDHNADILCSFNGQTKTIIAQNVVVNDLIVHNGKLYYSSTKNNAGFFAYDLTTKQTSKISDKNADGLTVYNGNIYFIQTAISFVSDKAICGGISTNDGHLYCYNGSTISKLA